MSMTTVLRGSKVKSHAWIQKSIIGWDSTVGQWVRIHTASGWASVETGTYKIMFVILQNLTIIPFACIIIIQCNLDYLDPFVHRPIAAIPDN